VFYASCFFSFSATGLSSFFFFSDCVIAASSGAPSSHNLGDDNFSLLFLSIIHLNLLFFLSLDNEGESCESHLNSDDQAKSKSSLTGRKYIFQFRYYSLSHHVCLRR